MYDSKDSVTHYSIGTGGKLAALDNYTKYRNPGPSTHMTATEIKYEIRELWRNDPDGDKNPK